MVSHYSVQQNICMSGIFVLIQTSAFYKNAYQILKILTQVTNYECCEGMINGATLILFPRINFRLKGILGGNNVLQLMSAFPVVYLSLKSINRMST